MSPIAVQTAGLKKLKIFVNTQGFPTPEGCFNLKKSIFFFTGIRRALQLVVYKTNKKYIMKYH